MGWSEDTYDRTSQRTLAGLRWLLFTDHIWPQQVVQELSDTDPPDMPPELRIKRHRARRDIASLREALNPKDD